MPRQTVLPRRSLLAGVIAFVVFVAVLAACEPPPETALGPDASTTVPTTAGAPTDAASDGTAVTSSTGGSASPNTSMPGKKSTLGVPGTSGQGDSFDMINELYPDGRRLAQQYLAWGIAGGVAFHSPLTSGERSLVVDKKLPFFSFNIPVDIGSCYANAYDAGTPAMLKSLSSQLGYSTWMLAMPEFDQGGGCWATTHGGRPTPTSDRQKTYDNWINFYRNTLGLGPYLNAGINQRGYGLAATCVYAFCAQYAYDMGADLVLLERISDEVSGITPGLAMLRGAARQHGDRPWGIDLSTWRYWSNSPTQYKGNGQLTGGWSPSWYKRHLFISFMGGADMTFAEAADYTTGATAGGLNPLGQVMQEFANYAQVRHPDRGKPFVPMAFIEDHNSGFEPKFGEYAQGDLTWYGTVPYNEGDKMLSNLLNMAYPTYNLHGTLVAGGPKTPDQYRERLAKGEDPRLWEPMGNSRWGESFDVLTNQASLKALQRYKAVVLSQAGQLSDAFRTTLNDYVAQGGVVVLSTKQLNAADEQLTGVHINARRASSVSSTWAGDRTSATEPAYTFTSVTPTTATVVAATGTGAPLITRNVVGTGEVFVVTADYAQDNRRTQVLNVAQRLVDSIQSRYVGATVSGPPCEYLVNTTDNATLVTIVNTGGVAWNGHIDFSATTGTVKDYTADTAVASSAADGHVGANVTVEPWDVKVFALEK